ncbi:MAG: rhomboid family intramembrane serine protease [Solirubrobacteraceae bacterium]
MFPLRDNIPTDRFPLVTVAFIVANVLVYFFLQDGRLGLPQGPSEWPAESYGAVPCELAQQCDNPPGDPSTALTVLTSMFMHGSILHLGGNMLFLWIFGNNVEDRMGPLKFIGFYVAGGAIAVAAQTIVNTDSAIPTIGASGAVAAVLGGYLLLFPRAKVVTVVFIIFFFTILELPALLFLGFWIVQQALFAYFDLLQPTGEGGGVAYFAHIGGFVFGLLVVRLLARKEPRPR